MAGMMAVVTVWGQVSTVDDVEEFLGADEWSMSKFLVAAVTVVIAVVVARLVRRGVEWALLRFTHVSAPTARSIARISSWAVILIGVVEALWIIGINVGPGVMILLVIAVIMFFAGRGVMANFSAGLVLQGSAMFDVGDQVATAAGTGTIQSVAGRTVVIKTPEGEEIHVPNKVMIEYPIKNLTRHGSRLSSIVVGLAHGTDLERAKAALLSATAECVEAHTEPPPEALITEFADSSINIEVRFWHAPTILKELRAIDAVAESIATTLSAHGIVIASPQRTLSWADNPTDAAIRTHIDSSD